MQDRRLARQAGEMKTQNAATTAVVRMYYVQLDHCQQKIERGLLTAFTWGAGCTHVMHGRSRMTIDPRIPTMPGRNTSGFTDQADIACTKREVPGGVGRVA